MLVDFRLRQHGLETRPIAEREHGLVNLPLLQVVLDRGQLLEAAVPGEAGFVTTFLPVFSRPYPR